MPTRAASRLAFAALAALASCGGSAPPSPWEAANPVTPLPATPLGLDGRLADLPDPPTPARVRLGRWLFHDPRLSADGTVSCATCHRPAHAFSEPTPVSTGVGGQQGTRKSPALVNLAFSSGPFFWDGRAATLEVQALGPIANPIEMGSTVEAAIRALRATAGYGRYFAEAFGDPGITPDRLARALADYERTLLSGGSAWDRWQAGDEAAATPAVRAGHELFFGRAGCGGCHPPPRFTDDAFHVAGVGWDVGAQAFADPGRFAVSGLDGEQGAFKTPPLRDVSRHPPYMHDGSLATLEAVVRFYAAGGRANPWLSGRLAPLDLTDAEVGALVAFLESLEGGGPPATAPAALPE